MTILQMLAGSAAVILAVAPQLSQAATYLAGLLPGGDKEPAGPSYKQAIDNLAAVRLRLRATDCFHDDQKAAIDVLTLALVDGSDK
jgi:hypothetical protein